MIQRKIQLIAGTTYTISLPKEWVKQSKLKAKSTVSLKEQGDGTLTILPTQEAKDLDSEKIRINLEEYGTNIQKILFAAYYLGFETIEIYSKEEINKDIRKLIKKAISYMSGTEIIFEDMQEIEIKVLLDQSKIQIHQILSRIGIIIHATIIHLTEDMSIKDIARNEGEIDRLYHLLTKMISLASSNTNMLAESEMRHNSYVMPYFLISKRLENIGDYLRLLSKYMYNNKITAKNFTEILLKINKKSNKYINLLIKKDLELFSKEEKNQGLQEIEKEIAKLKDENIKIYLKTIVRYLGDIKEQIIYITFYRNLIKQKKL